MAKLRPSVSGTSAISKSRIERFFLIVEIASVERTVACGIAGVQPSAIIEHHQFEIVFSLSDVGREVELGRRQRIGDLGYLSVVDPQLVGRLRIFQMQIGATVGPDVGYFDLLADDGPQRAFARKTRFGAEIDAVARFRPVAGVGIVTGVVRESPPCGGCGRHPVLKHLLRKAMPLRKATPCVSCRVGVS